MQTRSFLYQTLVKPLHAGQYGHNGRRPDQSHERVSLRHRKAEILQLFANVDQDFGVFYLRRQPHHSPLQPGRQVDSSCRDATRQR